MTKRSGQLKDHQGRALTGESAPLSRRGALLQFPPCVYVARLHDGLIKIGWSANIYRRLGELGPSPELLALRPGTLADEAAIHARLLGHAARGVEYYTPSAPVLAIVNEVRASAGLPPIVD